MLLTLLVIVSLTWADDAESSKKLDPKQIRATLLEQAKSYDIQLAKSGTRLKLHDRSLLNWNNPLRTTELGIVQVWTDDGMPMVVASLFTYEYKQTRLKHEFISLTDQRLTAKYDNATAWTPTEPGVKWQALPPATKSPAVATSKVRRLIQMRRIAAAFDFQVTSGAGEVSKLRLMTQPLFRFESKQHKVVDGAIFAYSIATDPEVLLILKAQENNKWEHAIVRSTNLKIVGGAKGQSNWSVEALPDLDGSTFGQTPFINYPYTSFHPTPDFAFESN